MVATLPCMGKVSIALWGGVMLLLVANTALADDFARRDAAMATFVDAFAGAGPQAGCGTPALHAVHAAWDALTGEDRHYIDLMSSPLYAEALESGAPSWLDAGDVSIEGRGVCFGPSDIDGFSTYELVVESEHFALFRVSGSDPLIEAMGDVLALLEESLESYRSRGWLSPGGIDDFQMLVFVDVRPPTLGGYTWVNPCSEAEGGAMDWLVLNEEWAQDSELVGPLITHELFHTVQRRYAFDELVTGWESSRNRWFAEASAVYEESLVYPAGGVIRARSARWSESPWLALNTFNGSREYQTFILPLAIEGVLGGPEWHLALWESIAGLTNWSVPEELEELGTAVGGWEGLFREYIARASEMDFPRVESLYGPRDLQTYTGVEGGLAGRYTVSELPVRGTVDGGSAEAPQSLGANYVWFETSSAGLSRALRLDVELDSRTPGGDPVNWAVEVLATQAGTVLERLSVTPDLASNRVQVLAHGVGESLDGVWLIASPLSTFTGQAPGWSWSARFVAGEEDLRLEEKGPGCACSNSGSVDGTALWSVLFVGWFVRRRRPSWTLLWVE